MATVSRTSLLQSLIEAYPSGSTDPWDLPALLLALAEAESSRMLGAQGDSGRSLGLWQVNQPVWQDVAGSYDPPGGSLADVLEYEVGYIAPLVSGLQVALGAGLQAVLATSSTGPIEFDAARDVPAWASIWWQFGDRKFRDWIDETRDFRAASFRQHWAGFTARIEKIATSYLDTAVGLWERLKAASVHYLADLATSAAKTLAIAAREIAEWQARVKDEVIADVTAPVKLVEKVALGTTLVIVAGLMAGYYAVTTPGPNGRHIRPGLEAAIPEVLGFAALLLL